MSRGGTSASLLSRARRLAEEEAALVRLAGPLSTVFDTVAVDPLER